MLKYPVGSVLSVTLTFTADAVVLNPTLVRVLLMPPGAAAVEYTYGTDDELTRVSTGVYRLRIATTITNSAHVGVWRGTAYSTGTGQAAVEFEFRITSLRVSP